MTKCAVCGGELKRHKRVTRVVGKQMVKGHIFKCADCGRLVLNSEVWQRVDIPLVAPSDYIKQSL